MLFNALVPCFGMTPSKIRSALLTVVLLLLSAHFNLSFSLGLLAPGAPLIGSYGERRFKKL